MSRTNARGSLGKTDTRGSLRKSFKMYDEEEEIRKEKEEIQREREASKTSRSMRPISYIENKKKGEEISSFQVDELKSASMDDREIVKQNYAFYFGNRERRESGTRVVLDLKVDQIVDIVENQVEKVKGVIYSIVGQLNSNMARSIGYTVFNTRVVLTDIKILLRQLNDPTSTQYRRSLSDDVADKLVTVGSFACEVGLHVTTQIVIEHVTRRAPENIGYYVITPSLNIVNNIFIGILSFLTTRNGMRRISNRGGTRKRRIRREKSTKKHKKHKKSNKKYKKHKKSTKKYRKHKKSTKK
jgi:hypothetical protein